jgi:hypothetical protein
MKKRAMNWKVWEHSQAMTINPGRSKNGAHLERLLQDKAPLGHGPFDGIDQQQTAIGQVEDALHLAAEVDLAACVDDVDLDALIGERRILTQCAHSCSP